MNNLNTTWWILLIAALSSAGLSMPSQADLTELRQRYESGACKHDQTRIVEDLRAYRRELWRMGRRNLQADFMLASCLCPKPGFAALSKLSARYRGLSAEDTEQIRHAANMCMGGQLVRYLPPGSGVAFVAGKGAMLEELIKHEHSQMSPEAVMKFEKRLFTRAEIKPAKRSLRRRGFKQVYAGDNFLVAGDYGRGELREINSLMEQVLNRLGAQYNLQPPQTLTTVYLFKTRKQLQRHASKEHDLQISKGTWAYTFPLDASISVWHSGGPGTVGHEVMHALINQNLPYAPPWLNEGSAALFEEFTWLDNGGIQGMFRPNHWRIEFLTPHNIPTLGDMLTMNWKEFDDPKHFQTNHATAKMFTMYLQEKTKLNAVLNAYKGKDLFELGDDTQVVEHVSGMDVVQLDEHFRHWLGVKLAWDDGKTVD